MTEYSKAPQFSRAISAYFNIGDIIKESLSTESWNNFDPFNNTLLFSPKLDS